MNAERRTALDRIVALSREMLDAANRQEWDELVMLEARRQPLVHEFFGSAVAADEAAAVAAGIQEILELDKATMARAEEGRKEAGAVLAQLATGRRAQQAYGENQR